MGILSSEDHVFVGQHEHRFEAPDRVYIFMRGRADRAHLDAQHAFLVACAERHGSKLYALVDLSGFDGMTNDARRNFEKDRAYPYHGCVFIGGSFTVRTVAAAVLRAGQLLAPRYFEFGIGFVATKAEAEAWIDEHRRQRNA